MFVAWKNLLTKNWLWVFCWEFRYISPRVLRWIPFVAQSPPLTKREQWSLQVLRSNKHVDWTSAETFLDRAGKVWLYWLLTIDCNFDTVLFSFSPKIFESKSGGNINFFHLTSQQGTIARICTWFRVRSINHPLPTAYATDLLMVLILDQGQGLQIMCYVFIDCFGDVQDDCGIINIPLFSIELF